MTKLAKDLVRRLGGLVTRRQVRAGRPVLTEDDAGDAVHLLLRGRVEVTARVTDDLVVRLATLGPGTVLGIGAVDAGGAHAATVLALEPVETLRIEADVWRALIGLDDADAGQLRQAALRSLARALPRARDLVECAGRCMRLALHERLYEPRRARA